MKTVNPVSLANALIWAFAILAVAIILNWSENEAMMIPVLGGAAGMSIFLVSNALRRG
jgi:Na+-transporting methylmalonyl-CoA/oxaloacetate decarboxylase beta subunit